MEVGLGEVVGVGSGVEVAGLSGATDVVGEGGTGVG